MKTKTQKTLEILFIISIILIIFKTDYLPFFADIRTFVFKNLILVITFGVLLYLLKDKIRL